jgi:predicted Zn-dependent peptidase
MFSGIVSLKNGIRVGVDEMHDVDTVSVYVCVGVGSRFENRDLNGVSHFLEHMAFKGTEKRNYQEIAETIDSVGGVINAYTSKETTCYYIKLLKEDVEIAFDVLSDILKNSTFLESEIEKEREVILQEMAANNDTPNDVAYDIFGEVTFGDTSLGRTILGLEKNIKSFKKDDFVNYIKRFYKNNRIIISVAGNVSTEKIVNFSERYFGSFDNDGQNDDCENAIYNGGLVVKSKKDLEQTQFLIGFRSHAYTNLRSFYETQIASAILGDGMSSRLFQSIREELGLVYSIYTFGEYYRDNGIFGIYAGTNAGSVIKLTNAVYDELKKFITDGIYDKEMQKVVKQFAVGLAMSSESTNHRAQRLGSNILKYGRYISNEEIMDVVHSVKKGDVIENMRGVLKQKPSIVCYGSIDENVSNEITEVCTKFLF